MGDELIESQNRVNRHYEPLTISKSLVCVSPGSPLLQTYGKDGVSPNREKVNCVVAPVIVASASDGSWDNQRSNLALANMVWYSNLDGSWKDISTISSWQGKYEIDTSSTNTRGQLIIKKNLSANGKEQLYLEADLIDYRIGTLLPLRFDPVTMSCVSKGGDTYGIGFGDSQSIIYNPFLDRLDLYEYKVANGLMVGSDAARAACIDDNSYERIVNIDVWKGKLKITSGYTLEVYRIENGAKTTLSVGATDELLALSLTSLKLDLRIVEQASYLVVVKVGGKQVAQGQFSVSRAYPAIQSPSFANAASINWGEISRYQQAVFGMNSSIIEYPQRIIRMLWKTKATNGDAITNKTWNEGENFEYAIGDCGIGDLESDKVYEIVAYAQKKAYGLASDASGNLYGDASGNVYIVR